MSELNFYSTEKTGLLSDLTTDDQTTLVEAINEVDANTDTNTSAIGTLSDLTTSVQTDLVSAINEVDANTDTNTTNIATNTSAIGTLSDLTTTETGTLVGAINENTEALETKAEIDGYYEDMTVGDAEQLVATEYVEDSVPYLFRTTGGSADVGNRLYADAIVGGTIAWNQLVDTDTESVTVTSGHKYYSVISDTATIASSSGTVLSVAGGTDMVIDLTQMFGTAVADYIYSLETANTGAGVAFFRSLFPEPYYEYNAGELRHVEGLTSHDTVGFNQWDEEWELGSFESGTGLPIASNTIIRAKNYINIIPDTVYCFTAPTNGVLFWYDANNTYISETSVASGGVVKTSPTNARYLKFRMASSYGTTYKNDICINLSWSGTRNGEYEAYKKHSYPLDSSLTLRGIPKLDSSYNLYYDGDTYEYDGTVTRKYAILEAQTASSGDTITLTGCDTSATDIVTTVGHLDDVGTLDGTTLTLSTDISSADIVYPLATETTETADAYTQIQICDDFGTEEFVSTGIVPVGHTTRYPANLRDKLQHLPDLADSDGTYLITQSDNEMTLTAYSAPTGLPDAPTTDGTYVLKATVSGGTPTYTWESEA